MSSPQLLSARRLKLWDGNPRLDPSQTYRLTHSFAEGICKAAGGDKEGFLKLVESIAQHGFIPFDPIIVWRDSDNGPFCVAEGNRRVLAIKLLLSPDSAPASIRTRIKKLSSTSSALSSIEKIPVLISPSLDDVLWYIAQRHNSASSLQKSWNREQQFRFVSNLYNSDNYSIKRLSEVLELPVSDILDMVRMLKLKDYACKMQRMFSEKEIEELSSPRFPLSTLERFVKYAAIKDRLKLEPNNESFTSKLSTEDFELCLTTLIKLILTRNISSRTEEEDVLKKLPIPTTVSSSKSWSVVAPTDKGEQTGFSGSKSGTTKASATATPAPALSQINNPDRAKLIPAELSSAVSSLRITDLFEELKSLPLSRYPNAAAASLRVLLDLSVHAYLERKGLFPTLKAKYHHAEQFINLKLRLEFLKSTIQDDNAKKVIQRLLKPQNEFSLDVLNGYIHSESNVFVRKQFLACFFDSISPLLKELDNITETVS